MNKRFQTRGIYMTSQIQSYLEKGKIIPIHLHECLEKHFVNLGHECEEDNQLNEYAIKHNDGRVVSVFNVNSHKVLIITDGLHLADDPVHGKDYPMTTILFPDEY